MEQELDITPPLAKQKPVKRKPSKVLLAGALASLLTAVVVGGIAYWQQKRLVREMATSIDALSAQLQQNSERYRIAADSLKALEKPFFYSTDGFPNVVRMISPESGEETDIVKAEAGVHWQVFAVPAIGYDGRIFLTSTGESDSPILNLHELNVETGELTVSPFMDSLPFAGKTSTYLSKDGTKLLALYDNPGYDPEGFEQGEVVVWNLLDGTKKTVGRVADDEYLAQNRISLGGTDGTSASWDDLECASVSVFQDWEGDVPQSAQDSDAKRYKERRTFCLNE